MYIFLHFNPPPLTITHFHLPNSHSSFVLLRRELSFDDISCFFTSWETPPPLPPPNHTSIAVVYYSKLTAAYLFLFAFCFSACLTLKMVKKIEIHLHEASCFSYALIRHKFQFRHSISLKIETSHPKKNLFGYFSKQCLRKCRITTLIQNLFVKIVVGRGRLKNQNTYTSM